MRIEQNSPPIWYFSYLESINSSTVKITQLSIKIKLNTSLHTRQNGKLKTANKKEHKLRKKKCLLCLEVEENELQVDE